uniref:Epidermal cell surface receptor n=1 Tax=Strigamia maritima TaxID=126957 RepID=T1J5W1_STRMM
MLLKLEWDLDDVCDVNGTWLSEGESITEGCERRCTCRPDGLLDCTARCHHLPGSITDPLCAEVPSTEDSCCVEYACAQIKEANSAPHLIVTGRGPSNVSVAWDDFKPPSYERGYVLEVRVAGSEGNRIQLQVNNTNMKTIEDLSPNVRYEVRVAILDDQDNLTSASEFINVTTTDGCLRSNTTYRVDDEWNEGCELKCTCRSNNTLDCSERCVRPLYRADSVSSDAHCTPVPNKDTCCVSLRCEQESDPSHAVSLCPAPDDTHTDHCVSTCKSDAECPVPDEICCPTSCGAKVCTNASILGVNKTDPCLNVVCGPQAKCQFSGGLAACQCNEGTVGNPNDYTHGCILGVPTSFGAGCSFNNSTHLPGESFFDGCEYRCLCNLNAEIECEPRCAPPAESLNDPTCLVIPDPNDSCCNITICGSHSVKEVSKKIKLDSLEGCYYKNKTYQKLDTIQEGCSMKCTCQGHGSISCVPRCPLTAPVGSGCVSLPDPIDSCCNVTICNITGLPDDLKVNDVNTTERREDVNLVTDTTIIIEVQVTSTEISLTAPMVTKIQNKSDFSKENYFPVPTKDAFNELGSTDAAKKGEGTAKTFRTIANMTQTSKLEETTLPETTIMAITTESSEISHRVKEVTPEISKAENAIGISLDKKTDISMKDVSEHQTSEMVRTTTPTISLLFPKVDKKDRGRKLEDKVTGLNNDIHCEINGYQMSIGQEINDGCRRMCKCQEGGTTSCTPISCPYTQPPQVSGCLDWRYDRDFVPKLNNCCAEAICLAKVPVPTGIACEYNGRSFVNFEPIPPSFVPSCDLECRCMNGNVSCESRCAPVPSQPPLTLTCIMLTAEILPLPHDKCCKAWQCPNLMMGNHEEDFDSLQGSFLPSLKTTPSGKNFAQNPFLVPVAHEEGSDAIFKTGFHPGDDPTFPGFTNMQNFPINTAFSEKECQTAEGPPRVVGEQWEESPGCRSRRCICVLLSNGSTNVECTGGCSPIEKYLKPTSGCPLPVLVTPNDTCFCPYVMCNKTDSGSSIQNLTAVAINATSVRVNLVIPKLYVGLYGQVELLYTDDATQTNTSTWNKEVFSHRNDMFAEAQMQHELNSLLPDTTYYIKADVILSGNSNTATSGVVTVRTPPLLASTTSATTLPSRITFDPSFNITDKQPTSIRLSWRPLTEQEKNLVDGVQLKYRIQGDETWGLTTIIHRDVTSYVLRDLQPNTAYEVDMALTPMNGVSTDIETLNPITFQTNPIHDDYAFDLTLSVDKVLITSMNLHWSGVPFPMHKYVHLYVIKYKMDSQTDFQTVYKHPKVEQVTLEDLKPGNRYQIWMEAILSNGGIRKSNTLEIVTKPGIAQKQPEKERLETSQTVSRPSTTESSGNNSYYEALIAVAVVAAICVLGFVALLVLLFRRQRNSSTAPNSTHKSQSAYENPTYKPSYDGELENGKTQA